MAYPAFRSCPFLDEGDHVTEMMVPCWSTMLVPVSHKLSKSDINSHANNRILYLKCITIVFPMPIFVQTTLVPSLGVLSATG